MSVVSWYNTGYHVVGRELRVYEGLLWRRTRAIPLERLQAVEVVRPLLAQLTGLAELRLEVVGGGKTEAPLAYLTVADAAALRDGCWRSPGGCRRPPAGGATPRSPARRRAVPPPRRSAGSCTRCANRDLLISQLLTPQALVAAVRRGVRGAAVRYNPVVVVHRRGEHADRDGRRAAAAGPAGARRLELPARPATTPRCGCVHGLLETRAQTVPLDRVQGVAATWPLLWRSKGWLRLRLDVAGVRRAGARQRAADRPAAAGRRP